MRVLFIIQGEGKGHLTQAVSLCQLLMSHNHQVVACLVGKGEQKECTFLESQINVPIEFFLSPNLVYGNQDFGLSLKKTIVKNVRRASKFKDSVVFLKERIKYYTPDLIVNFYDLLAGLSNLLSFHNRIPLVSVGHQYLMLHPDFMLPSGKVLDRILLNINTRITALGSAKIIALSLSPFSSCAKISSVPPLLRHEVRKEETNKYDFILAYMTNEGFLASLIKWHVENQEVEVHCFVNRDQEQEVVQFHKNLFIHKPHATKFLKLMANCRGLVTSAGFESVTEALYYNKPIMMIPVPNHFEQSCNAKEAFDYGAGIISNDFQLDVFLNYIDEHKSPSHKYHRWLKSGEHLIISELEKIANGSMQKYTEV